MTNKDAISRIRFLLDVGGSDGFTSADIEALNTAINALSAETTAPQDQTENALKQITAHIAARKWTEVLKVLAIKISYMKEMPECCEYCLHMECKPHPYKGWTDICGLCSQTMDDDAPEEWQYDGNGRPKACPLVEITESKDGVWDYRTPEPPEKE